MNSNSSENISILKKIAQLEEENRRLTDQIKHQRKFESQLMQAQKMNALASLSGGIAHDFNNILQAISGYSQLAMATKTEHDPDYKTFFEIEEIIKRGSQLTRQLLAVGRKIRPKFRPLNLNAIVESARKLISRTIPKMNSFELKLSDNLRMIKGDKGQIEHVLINLCINAHDAMSNKGTLTIKTANVEKGKEPLSGGRYGYNSAYVLLTVSDTGCGMPPKIRERIFDPFFTAKKKGNGLGLFMVDAIVRNHGGVIECDSEVEKGTEFRIFFPALVQERIPKKSCGITQNVIMLNIRDLTGRAT